MGTKFLEVVRDNHGIGVESEYCGDNDAQLDRTNFFTTRPRAASLFPARRFSTSSPA
jgi:hypothetical protein